MESFAWLREASIPQPLTPTPPDEGDAGSWRVTGRDWYQIIHRYAKASMHTSKVIHSPEQLASSTPATKPAPNSLGTLSLRQSASLSSRPVLPSLLESALDARDVGQAGQVAHPASPRLKPTLSPLSEDRKGHGENMMAAPAVSSGAKRARDGKDGPEGTRSRAEEPDQQTTGEKQRAHGREPASEDDADSHAQPSGKRARKTSKATKRGKPHRPKPANDGTGEAKPPGLLPKTAPAATLPDQGGSIGSDTAGASTWKPGAQSPKKDRAHRGSVTLSPRRSSNASAVEPASPARRTEDLRAQQMADVVTVSSARTLSGNDFRFSACDSDHEGVIHAVPGSALSGNEKEKAPSSPSPQAGRVAVNPRTTPPVQHDVPQQAGLAPDMTALLDELDAALAKPIGM